MKIVHVANYFLPEFGSQEYYLARCHADLGHEVHVLTSNRAYADWKEYAAFAGYYPARVLAPGVSQHENFRVHRLRAVCERNLQLILVGLLRTLDALAPDLVIMHGFSRYETLRLVAWKNLRRQRCRLVVDDHMLFANYEARLYRRVYHALFRALAGSLQALEAIDRLVPVSEESRRFLIEHFGLPPEKMTVIPIGADCELFSFSAPARQRRRAELGLDAGAEVAIYAGKVVPERGIHLLCEALSPQLAARPRLRLLIVGSGVESDYAESIRARARAGGVAGQLIWRPNVPHAELPSYFSAADLAVWPLQETMAALEAAACGLPLVLRNSQIARERTAGGNGLNCETLDDTARAVARLLDDAPLRGEMGRRGAEFIRRELDWRRIAERFIAAAFAVDGGISPSARPPTPTSASG